MSEKGFLTLQETAEAVGGRLLCSANADINEKIIFSVSIDSRKTKGGALFFALKGENQDGHDYINDAVSAGAVCVAVEIENNEIKSLAETGKCAFIIVKNTLKALQSLAGYYRSSFENIMIIGVTGSSGKTTTKDLIASIFELEGPTVKNEGNLNSETGLPLSLFNLRKHHKYGVFELGMNHPGEMKDIADILKPDFAVLTNIGTAHIGNLGSIENIAEEKIKIFQTGKNLKAGIIWEDDRFARSVREKIGDKIEYFGEKNTWGLISVENAGLDGSILYFGDNNIRLPLIGRHNLNNALAAFKTARFFNISFDKIKTAIEKAVPLFGRGQIFKGKTTVISDCYNSNLESVKSALEFMTQLEWNGRKIVLLGSILELGAETESIHSEVLENAAAGSPDAVFLFGREFENSWKKYSETAEKRMNKGIKIFWSDNHENLTGEIISFLKPGDIVLVKGSRGMALESFIDPILKVERKVVNC